MLPDQENQKNLLLAIVLSVAVLLAWQFFYASPRLKEEQDRQARIRQEQAKTKEQAPPGAPQAAPDAAPGKSGAVPAPASATSSMTRQAAVDATPRVRIETPGVTGSIALKGGRIDDVVLAKYRETVDPKSPNVVLFSPSGSPHPYYAEYGWIAGPGVSQPMPNQDTVWRRTEQSGPLTPAAPLTLVWDNGQGLVFRRTISVDANYLFTVSDEVENKSDKEVSLYPYALISRHGMPKVDGYYILHEGPIGVMGSAGLQEIGYADVLKEGSTKTFKQTGGWLGFTDKYWAAALIPNQTVPYEAHFSGAKVPRIPSRPTSRARR